MKKIIISAAIAASTLVPVLSLAANYGSNFLTGGTPTSDSNGPPTNVFDGNLATDWGSTNTAHPHWVAYDLGAGNENHMDKIDLYPYNDAGGRALKCIEIQGSNDNFSTYDIVFATTTLANETSGEPYYVLYSTSTGAQGNDYRYFRLWSSCANYSANSGQDWIWEWQGYACLDCTTGTTTIESIMSGHSDIVLLYLRYFFDIIIVAGVAFLIYKFIKKG